MTALFLDIDGTLVAPETGLVTNGVRNAIRQIQSKGHLCVLVSGRPPFAIEGLAQQLGIDTYICCNGGLAISANQIIYDNPIPSDVLSQFVTYAEHQNHTLVFPGMHHYVTTRNDDSVLGRIVESFHWSSPILDENYSKSNPVYQIELLCAPPSATSYIERFKEHFRFYPWHVFTHALNVNPISSSKATAMNRVLNHFSMDASDAIAIGDGPNDVEMIEAAGLGIAMGNACEELKAAADFVTRDVREDGVVYAARHLGFLR